MAWNKLEIPVAKCDVAFVMLPWYWGFVFGWWRLVVTYNLSDLSENHRFSLRSSCPRRYFRQETYSFHERDRVHLGKSEVQWRRSYNFIFVSPSVNLVRPHKPPAILGYLFKHQFHITVVDIKLIEHCQTINRIVNFLLSTGLVKDQMTTFCGVLSIKLPFYCGLEIKSRL